MADETKPNGENFPVPEPLSPEARAAQRRRNIWLGLALVAFVVLVAITTMIKISTGTGIAERM
ncbi:MAG TPA: hypothetical protein PLR76_08050 [Hyphomonas sp.]|nr:hypothetical protein [Hyphomonas sp.]MCB9960718.1 hypothetical protein [Hyphomonas sp.]MCB9971933.1 hypothetical protein [Hyphomonas sp.]HPE48332.1 hypothetical protein [Hyphomonas sp.]